MNIYYKQPQFELFPPNATSLEEANKPRFFLANLSLSLESLVILLILIIMIGLFAFSLGVERGKQLTAQALDERVSAAWNLAPRKPVMPIKTPTANGMKPVAAPVVKAPAALNARPAATTAKTAVPVKALVPVKAAAPVVAVKAGERFTVQLATYKSETYAMADAKELKSKGLPAFLIKKGGFWLLCLGQYDSKGNAEGVQKKLSAKFKGSSVRRF